MKIVFIFLFLKVKLIFYLSFSRLLLVFLYDFLFDKKLTLTELLILFSMGEVSLFFYHIFIVITFLRNSKLICSNFWWLNYLSWWTLFMYSFILLMLKSFWNLFRDFNSFEIAPKYFVQSHIFSTTIQIICSKHDVCFEMTFIECW